MRARRFLLRVPFLNRFIVPLPLLLLCGLALLLLTFMQLADAVTEGDAHVIDTWLLHRLEVAADAPPPVWLLEFVRDVTALGSVGIISMITTAAVGFLLLQGKRGSALLIVVAVIGGLIAGTLLKIGFDRPRPDFQSTVVRVMTASFPSGHAMNSATAYLTLGVLLARTQRRLRLRIYLVAVAIAMTVMVGYSRVYLGVHWPSDVLAGWAIGSAWAMFCWLVATILQQSGRIEPEPEDGSGEAGGR
ncbi:phosphatase PAP2 family protein [Marinivivus vitaminiproducens]|uniref:phosphatase PAP2 family protein n=1 Tax=Marinivivus vitaminiproducens TaxID=3035935 RepID=UPI0027AA63C3|nr:phosphatase PAP2 family protein [Geminicoccaceae bacterium SCSIO 64248]